jgi:hypothetical protein
MTSFNAKNQVLSEFFTNLAVAWFSAGVISPFFIKPKPIDFLIFSAIGILNTMFSLQIAMISKEKQE